MDKVSISRAERLRRISATFAVLMWIAMRRFWQLLQLFGLTPAQFMVLFALVRARAPRAMNDLTDITLQDAPTMTGIIDRLEKAGLVERTRSTTDRRVVLVQATPAGVALFKQVSEKLLDDDLAGCSILTDEELADTEALFQEIFRIHLKHFHIDVENVEDIINLWDLPLHDLIPLEEVPPITREEHLSLQSSSTSRPDNLEG
ncbi:MAG: MarR family transcriptional regulator [Anaerolineae bacterium]|nr:MarR family transcriptional regulator [Anaerolineae bacterium]MDW8070891.1 MarR family transcriptional regulator [Anaerolineae bacterium]